MMDQAEWSCSTLKLLSLSAGKFDAEHVLGVAAAEDDQTQPSWMVGMSVAASDNARTAGGLLSESQHQHQQSPIDSRRSQWSRPWREPRYCPSPRWEKSFKSFPVSPRRALITPRATTSNPMYAPKRGVFIDLPSPLITSSAPPDYTTKYFGLVGGQLGVMSKVDQLGPRPLTRDSWRMAAMSPGTDLMPDFLRQDDADKRGCRNFQVADSSTTAPEYETATTVDCEGGPVSRDLNTATKSHPSSRSSSIGRRRRLFTPVNSSVTKPVEGPEPPPWSRSRIASLCDPFDCEILGGSIVPVLPVSTAGGEPRITTKAGSEPLQVVNHNYTMTESDSFLWGDSCVKEVNGEDDSSSLASSYVSALWSVSDDNYNDLGRPPPSLCSSAKVLTTKSKPVMPAKARYRQRARDHRGSDGKGVRTAAPSVRKTETGESQEKGVLSPPQPRFFYGNNNHFNTRRPQPELYDVWIPQQSLPGKALPKPGRLPEEFEVQLQPVPGLKVRPIADISKRKRVAVQSTAASNEGTNLVHDYHGHFHQPPQLKRFPTTSKRCTVHHVSGPEGFVKENGAPPQPTSTITEEPCAKTTAPRGTGKDSPTASFGKEGTTTWDAEAKAGADGHSDTGRMARTSDHALHPGVNRGVNSDGFVYGDDVAGLAPAGDDSLEENKRTLESLGDGEGPERDEGELAKEHDEEYFDYAKRFSWQTVTEVVKEAEAEAEARANEQQRHGRQGQEINNRDGTEDGAHRPPQGGEHHGRNLAIQGNAAVVMVSERATERSDHATLVAVGRLRAPQSVFNPLHRAPSRPEMRRSITHGRFSPVGRKLWRQSDGLSPRTGQLCLSPRRRELGGQGFGVISLFGGRGGMSGTTDVSDWADLPRSSAMYDTETQRGFINGIAINADYTHGNIADQLDSHSQSSDKVSLLGRRYSEDRRRESRQEANARDGNVVASEGARALLHADHVDVNADCNQQGGNSDCEAVGRRDESAPAALEARKEQGAVSATDRDGERGRRNSCSRSTSLGGIAKFEDDDEQIDTTMGAQGIADPRSHSTITRSLSYTVKIPWDGQN